MTRKLLCTLALVTGAWIGFAANPAGAATTAAGPYYADPSWDQQLPASTRFVVLSNWIDAAHPSGGAAVLDRETGLVWEQSPSTEEFTWEEAQFHCNGSDLFNPNRAGVRVGNRLGWRLPTLQEVVSLVDPSVSPGPTLPSGHPFTNVQSSNYWSASTLALATPTSEAWFAGFYFGGVGMDPKNVTFFAWCVRGGQGVDPQ